ncbi:MAG TPA: methyltransferase domain-containing protein [Dehalococcoidia bacterium]|nr:methyltransferase domain-containing protein [Dehalococcoidia bacterium]
MSPSHEPAQARITGFWSTVAPEYEAHGGNVPARGSAEYGAWVAAIRELLPPAPADVLDIATGTGFVALIAVGLGHRVTGIDLAGPMLGEARAEARRRALSVAFELGDAVAPGFPAESFDAIVNRHFIWTLREPLLAVRNWLRLLRPGGRVVAIDGFWFAQASDDAAADAAPNLFDQHYTPETRAALPAMQLTTAEPIAALCKQAGFASVTIGDLAAVHAVADDPPSSRPWYVVVAHR